MKNSILLILFISISTLSYAQKPTTKKPTTPPKKTVPAKKPNAPIQEEIIEEPEPVVITQTPLATKPEDRDYDFTNSDLAVKWHNLMFDLVEQSLGFSPNVTARAFAYTNLAYYHAILPQYPDYQALSGQVQGFQFPDSLKIKSQIETFYAPAAANSALFTMVDKLFYNAPFIWMEKVYGLRDSVNNYYLKTIPKERLDFSNNYGEKVAHFILKYSEKDGGHQAYMRTYDMRYKLPICHSCFQFNRVADLENMGALHPYWGDNRTFSKENAQDLGINPKVEFSIYRGTPFYKQALEVYNISREVKPGTDKLQIANFWDDAATFSFTAAGHSVSILTQVLKAKPTSLEKSAELYCKLSLGLNDAFIACWKSKYKHNLIRPITYIKTYIDSKWEAALLTPPFPEFPSGHSVQSATMATILTAELGEKYEFTDFSKYFVGQPKTFTTFWEAANEASISRLYGGIHFRDALEQGKEMGKIVGANVLKLRFKK
jgi:hypothetical protein